MYMHACMYVCIIRGSRVGLLCRPAPCPQSPKLYTTRTYVWTYACGCEKGGCEKGGCEKERRGREASSSENGSVRGTEPRVSVRWFQGRKKQKRRRRRRVRVSPECIDSTVPQFLCPPSLSLAFLITLRHQPFSLPSFLLLPFSWVAIHPRAPFLHPSIPPALVLPPPVLASSPRRGFIDSLITASVSLDRLATYADAISKILRTYVSMCGKERGETMIRETSFFWF